MSIIIRIPSRETIINGASKFAKKSMRAAGTAANKAAHVAGTAANKAADTFETVAIGAEKVKDDLVQRAGKGKSAKAASAQGAKHTSTLKTKAGEVKKKAGETAEKAKELASHAKKQTDEAMGDIKGAVAKENSETSKEMENTAKNTADEVIKASQGMSKPMKAALAIGAAAIAAVGGYLIYNNHKQKQAETDENTQKTQGAVFSHQA